MKQKSIALLVMFVSSSVLAQNTSREPMQGGASNPVTQHEASQETEQKPLTELVQKKKKKPKTTIKAEPAKPSDTSTPDPAPPATPAQK